MSASGLTFLFVEEHAFQRSMIVKLLQGAGARTVVAPESAREALQMVRSLPEPLDVLMTDFDIAGMDGFELIRHVGSGRYCHSLICTRPLERGLLACIEAMSAAYGLNFLGALERPGTRRSLDEALKFHQRGPAMAAQAAAPRVSFAPEEIVDGLENGEFEPFYQPKIDINTWRIVGAEALARWRHPQQGIVLPQAFIKPLEDAGKIHMLLRSILRQSAHVCHLLRAAGHDMTMSVNLSFKSLTDPTLAEQITTVTTSGNVAPEHVVLEITESAASTDVGPALENLARLRMKGFGLALDDYGRGHSVIEQLARIPFTEMKVDQSLVYRASRHESARVVLESSLEMARRLNIKTLAEAVETRASWEFLGEVKFDMAQGDYLATPMSEPQFLAWVRDRTTEHGTHDKVS